MVVFVEIPARAFEEGGRVEMGVERQDPLVQQPAPLATKGKATARSA
jgi:hypothetical protein